MTSWDLLSLWLPQTLVSSAPEAPFFRLAGLAVCHRQDGQHQSRVTFQRHRDLFNFQNSPLFSLLIRGSEAPVGEAVWHLSLNFETNGLELLNEQAVLF